LGVYVDGALTMSFPPTPGRTYFVNNITGASTNDGLSWGTAMDQVSTAITASDTYRELGGIPSGRTATTNDYVRNTIVVQGTGTAYTYLTDLGEHLNLIGLCQPTGGQGGGTSFGGVRLGADTSNTTGGYIAAEDNASRSYGVYLANLKFQSGDASACWQTHKFEESVMEDCAFYLASGGSASPAAYIDILTSADSSIFRRLHTGSHGGMTDRAVDGFTFSTGTYFINCIVEDCCIGAQDTAFNVPITMVNGYGSIVRQNLFGTMGQGNLQFGIQGLSTRTMVGGGLITYYDNWIQAIDAISATAETTRFIHNHVYGAEAS